MPYTYDASDASSLMVENDYEATIERMERKTLPSGKEKLSVMFRIRDDVDQKYRNKVLFKDIWEEKDNPGVFNRKMINKLLGTQEIEDGHEFETLNDVIDFLVGCNLIIHVSVEFDEYRGENVNTVSYYKKSKAQANVLGSPKPEDKPDEEPLFEGEIDEELPF